MYLFRDDIRLVEERDNFLKGAHERHIRITVLLHLEKEAQF